MDTELGIYVLNNGVVIDNYRVKNTAYICNNYYSPMGIKYRTVYDGEDIKDCFKDREKVEDEDITNYLSEVEELINSPFGFDNDKILSLENSIKNKNYIEYLFGKYREAEIWKSMNETLGTDIEFFRAIEKYDVECD